MLEDEIEEGTVCVRLIGVLIGGCVNELLCKEGINSLLGGVVDEMKLELVRGIENSEMHHIGSLHFQCQCQWTDMNVNMNDPP